MVVEVKGFIILCFLTLCPRGYGDFLRKDGKCYPDGPIANLADLNNCREIYGTLSFEPFLRSTTTYAKIEKIEGCLYIENTDIRELPLSSSFEISCPQPEFSIIAGNKKLCIEDKKFLDHLKDVVTLVDIHYDTEDCPLCFDPSDYYCKTLYNNFTVNKGQNISRNLHTIRGILKVSKISNKWFENRTKSLKVANYETSDPAIQIEDSFPPSNDFLLMLSVAGYGNIAVSINIPAYVIPRHIYLKMKADTLKIRKHQIIDASVEGPTDCYYSSLENERAHNNIEELFYCETLYWAGTGSFSIYSNTIKNLDKMKVKWIDIKTTASKMEFKGGDELLSIFKQQVSITHTSSSFELELKLDQMCYHSELINLAKKWFIPDEQFRLTVTPAHNCHTAYGDITEYDLRKYNGNYLRFIKGTLSLNTTRYHLLTSRDKKLSEYDSYGSNFERFKAVESITKTWDNPVSQPALEFSMCLFKHQLPKWVFTIRLGSPRNEDILLRIDGPGYRMKQEEYEILEKKYTARRLHITPMLPGECLFDRPITDLADLNGCDAIVGDLTILGNVRVNTSASIRYVTGCIKIKDTNLENINFLQFENSYDRRTCLKCKESNDSNPFEIKNNPNLCVDHVPFGVPRSWVTDNKKNCGNELKLEEIENRNFLIYGIQNSTELPDWSHVKEIRGRIVVTGCTFTEFNLFPNLTRIIYNGIGAALVVENNPNLVELRIPNLEKVVMLNHDVAIVIKNNPVLNQSDEDRHFFEKAAGSRKVVYAIEKTTIVEEVKNETITSNKRMINIGIGVGIGGALIVVAAYASILLILSLWSSKSAKENKKEANDEVKDTPGENSTSKQIRARNDKRSRQINIVDIKRGQASGKKSNSVEKTKAGVRKSKGTIIKTDKYANRNPSVVQKKASNDAYPVAKEPKNSPHQGKTKTPVVVK